MNIHITHDDKFIDYIIDISPKVGSVKNKFIIYQETLQPIKHIRNLDSISIFNIDSQELKELFACKTYPQTVNIYIHFLNPMLYSLILTVPEHVNLIWCFWGEDAFALPKLRIRFLSKKTKSILKNYKTRNTNYTFLKYLYPKEIYRYYYRLLKKHQQQRKYENLVNLVIKRFDYFAHYIEADYNLIRNAYPLNAKYINFSYMSIDAAFNFQLPSQVSLGKNILLGNSANPTNNHFDVIKYLSKIKFDKNQQVYCPLNYSINSERYIDELINLGNKTIKHFSPITDLLSKEKYHEILHSCSVAIMPHYRSQAWGNIMVLLWLGVAVFLSKKSSLFKLLKTEYNMIIYSIEDDFQILMNKGSKKLLSQSDILRNRDTLVKFIGEEKKREIIKDFLMVGYNE